jgi:hypothetical protein
MNPQQHRTPNQAMSNLRASLRFQFVSVCHLPFARVARVTGLAVGDLGSR